MEKETQTVREMTAQERLSVVEAERKDLIEQVRKEKAYLKENKTKIKAERDKKLKETAKTLKAILYRVFTYNRLGMTDKLKINILEEISQLIGGENDGKGDDDNQEDDQ